MGGQALLQAELKRLDQRDKQELATRAQDELGPIMSLKLDLDCIGRQVSHISKDIVPLNGTELEIEAQASDLRDQLDEVEDKLLRIIKEGK